MGSEMCIRDRFRDRRRAILKRCYTLLGLRADPATSWHMPRPRPREPRARAHVVFAALCALGLTARVASQCANMKKDPHLAFARGGRADFRGRDGKYCCFLSAPRLAINIKTEDATFRLHNLYDKGGTLVVDGSFITEAHLVALVGGVKQKRATVSFCISAANRLSLGASPWRESPSEKRP